MTNTDLLDLGCKLSNFRTMLVKAINTYVADHYSEVDEDLKMLEVTGFWFRDVLVNFEDGTQAKGSVCTLTNQGGFVLDTNDGEMWHCD
ncbi:MAG: hypothetical protein PUF37_01080 [Prevotellaceae bacterium]|nr:hypothetical protein [Prevotellaceae bacterium]